MPASGSGPAVAPKDIAFRAEPAEDAQRQDHAPAAEGARARPARRRHLDPGKRRAMTAAADKPHLTRAHVLELLRQMIRIRRFEDKCAELYTQEKIRGFLHLYDGEEAIAVGVIPVLEQRDRIVATYREHGHALVRGVPMTPVMAEMYGKREGCSRRTRRLDAPVRRRAPTSTAATPSSAAACRWPSGWRWPTTCAASARHRLLLRRGRRRRGRIPREPQPRRAVGPAGAVRLREQSLRHGHGAGALRIRDRHPAQGRRAIGSPPRPWTAWTWSRSRRPRAAPSHASARPASPYFLECRTYRFRAAFDVRRPALSRQGRGRGMAAEGSDRPLPAAGCEANRLIHPDDVARIEAEVDAEIAEAVAFAEAGTWEPVEELTRFTYAERPAQRATAMHLTTAGRNGRNHLPRGRARGDPRRDAARRSRLPDGRGCRPLWRLLCGQQGPAGRIRPRAHPRHAAVRVRLHRRGHRRGDGRHAADRRADDGQFQPARARPDPQHRRHHPAHVGQPVRRAAGDPHGDRRGPAARRPAFAQPGGLVRAHSRASRCWRRRPSRMRAACCGPRCRIPIRC